MRRFIQQAAQIHNLAAGDKLPELFRRRFIARVSAAVLRHNNHPSPHRTTAALNLRRRRGRAAQPEKLRAAPRPPRPHRGSHGRVGGAFHVPASSVVRYFLFRRRRRWGLAARGEPESPQRVEEAVREPSLDGTAIPLTIRGSH